LKNYKKAQNAQSYKKESKQQKCYMKQNEDGTLSFGAMLDLSGVQRAFLVGNTQAEIKCDQTALYRIILMHGASAEIEASGYSVVKIERDENSEVKGSFSGMAKRL